MSNPYQSPTPEESEKPPQRNIGFLLVVLLSLAAIGTLLASVLFLDGSATVSKTTTIVLPAMPTDSASTPELVEPE